MGGVELVSVGEGIGSKVLVYVSNLGILGCFLLVYFGGAIVVNVVILLVTGGKTKS